MTYLLRRTVGKSQAGQFQHVIALVPGEYRLHTAYNTAVITCAAWSDDAPLARSSVLLYRTLGRFPGEFLRCAHYFCLMGSDASLDLSSAKLAIG